MLSLVLASLAAAAPAPNTLRLNAPAGEALMLVARQAQLNLFAGPLTGHIKGDFPVQSKDALTRAVLEKVKEPVVRREEFIFAGKEPSSKGFPKVPVGRVRVSSLWEREMTAGALARVLSLALDRPVEVAAPFDREPLTVVLTNTTAEDAVAAMAFFLNLQVTINSDGSVSLGEPGASVTKECAGFSLTEWSRLAGLAPGVYPLGLLTTGGVTCPTETGRRLRTSDGELLKTLGPDGNEAMLYRWESGSKAGTYVRVGFNEYTEIRACDDITRDSKLKRTNPSFGFALLTQGIIECGVTRATLAGEFQVIDIDAKGPYVMNPNKEAKAVVLQVTARGVGPAEAPAVTK